MMTEVEPSTAEGGKSAETDRELEKAGGPQTLRKGRRGASECILETAGRRALRL